MHLTLGSSARISHGTSLEGFTRTKSNFKLWIGVSLQPMCTERKFPISLPSKFREKVIAELTAIDGGLASGAILDG
eukprot:6477639-Amphidinium_carterae.1